MRGKRLVVLSTATLVAVIILMALAALLSGLGPRGIRNPHFLSEAEKAEALRIALGNNEVRDVLSRDSTYTVEYRWVYIYRDGLNRIVAVYDYEDLGKVVAEMPKGARLYVSVALTFGDPPNLLLEVAVNPETGAVADVQGHPLSIIPAAVFPGTAA